MKAFDTNGELIDLEISQKLDAIFDDFRLFVKMTSKLSSAKELLQKKLKTLTGKTCKRGEQS